MIWSCRTLVSQILRISLPPRSPKRQLSAGRPSQPRCLASPSGLRRSGPSGHGQSPTAGLSQVPSLPAGAESGRHPPGLGWISGFGGLGKQQCGREKGRKVSGRQTCVSVRAFRERESGALLGRWGVRLFTGQLRRWAGWWIAGLETNKQTQLYICI